MRFLLLFSVTVIATCGLIYELIAGTVASYLLGDSVTQFSMVIGVYLFAMGIGAFLSKYITRHLVATFIGVEIAVGLIGGVSSLLFFTLFNYVEAFRLVLFGIITITGILVGLEIPLMMNILKKEIEFKDLISRVFSFDYAGALLASIAFPLFFVPHLGIMKTSLFFGMLNVAIALVILFVQRDKRQIILKFSGLSAFTFLMVLFVFSDRIMNYAEEMNYGEHILYSQSTPYQRITITGNKQGKKLYLNNNLQFNSADEYRYHEALVHPAFCLNPKAEQILILGGGDGLAAREVLKYPFVGHVTLVDLDPAMTKLFRQSGFLSVLNHHSLSDTKMRVINQDAFAWLRKSKETFDIIIIDFPDPSNYSVGKLYTDVFYQEISRHLNEQSVCVVQSTSPFVAPNSFWCVVNTIRSTGMQVLPYHNYVPSFGDWGYIIFSKEVHFEARYEQLPPTRFFDSTAFADMIQFTKDIAYRATDINKLNNQALVSYFETEWGQMP